MCLPLQALSHGLVLNRSSALPALKYFSHLLLISGSFLLCIYQETLVPVFLQTADENHHLSWRMGPAGWLALVYRCMYPYYTDF